MAMESEFWTLCVKGNDIAAYDLRFLQLCTFCPGAVTPESRKIERYIWGLPGSIQASVTAAQKETIEEVMQLANTLILQVVRRVERRANDDKAKSNKRKNNDSSEKQTESQPSKKTAVVPFDKNGKKKGGHGGSTPLCTRCEKRHIGFCNVVCEKCNRQGHIGKNCRILNPTPISSFKPVADPSTSNTCYNCNEAGHIKRNCPKLKNSNAKAPSRVFSITAEKAKKDPRVVNGKFLL